MTFLINMYLYISCKHTSQTYSVWQICAWHCFIFCCCILSHIVLCFQTIIMLVQCHAQICHSIEQHLLSNWIEMFDSEAMLQPHYLKFILGFKFSMAEAGQLSKSLHLANACSFSLCSSFFPFLILCSLSLTVLKYR